jgi:hypothetical protein
LISFAIICSAQAAFAVILLIINFIEINFVNCLIIMFTFASHSTDLILIGRLMISSTGIHR